MVEGGAWVGLQAELAVGRLAPALASVACLILEHQVDGRRGDGFVDVAAADAGAVGAVPVALGDHRAFAAGANPGERYLHGHNFSVSDLLPQRGFICESKNRVQIENIACQYL